MKSILICKRALFAGVIGLSFAAATGLFAQTSPQMPDASTKVVNVTKTGSLRGMAAATGYDGQSPANLAFVVRAGVNILGLPGGKPGLDTGQWPEGSRLWLTIDGNVYGGGGNGGSGGDIPGATDGGKGGDAIYVRTPLTIVVTAKGSLKGGGGGGGGANGSGVGGSGGGGGFPNGVPGEAGSATSATDSTSTTFSERGKYGTPGGGGQGGARGNPGGAGGNAAMPGEAAGRAGGSPGNAVQKNGYAVTLLNYGQIYGEVF